VSVIISYVQGRAALSGRTRLFFPAWYGGSGEDQDLAIGCPRMAVNRHGMTSPLDAPLFLAAPGARGRGKAAARG